MSLTDKYANARTADSNQKSYDAEYESESHHRRARCVRSLSDAGVGIGMLIGDRDSLI